MPPQIPKISAAACRQPDVAAAALREAGVLVITGLAPPARRDPLQQQLEPFFEATPTMREEGPEEFYAGDTRRIPNILSKASLTHGLAADPVVLGAMDAVLLPSCDDYQLHVATSLNIGPGARSQVLHREDAWDGELGPDYMYPQGIGQPRKNLIVAGMWALTDFTQQNGATLIVPGSHCWEPKRQATAEETVSAEMAAGDVLLWLGGTLHAAGANVTRDEWRKGVFISYSLGWLRTEENFGLELTADAADQLPERVRELVGFKMHGGLGFFSNDVHRYNRGGTTADLDWQDPPDATGANEDGHRGSEKARL